MLIQVKISCTNSDLVKKLQSFDNILIRSELSAYKSTYTVDL